MRVCAVSDLHGQLPKIPPVDILIIAGDLCPDAPRGVFGDYDLMKQWQMEWLRDEFHQWQRTLPPSIHIILYTPGNHDFIDTLPRNVSSYSGRPMHMGVDELVFAYGKRFWLTPWVNACGPWNWMADRITRGQKFADIPDNIDVLICHTPPHKCLDKAYGDYEVGCEEMRQAIYRAKPKWAVFGHIHEGQRYGRTQKLGETMCVNVAQWGLTWEPFQFDLETPTIDFTGVQTPVKGLDIRSMS